MHYVVHSRGASTVKSSLEALLTWLHKFEAVRLALYLSLGSSSCTDVIPLQTITVYRSRDMTGETLIL